MSLVMYDTIHPDQFHGLPMDAAAGYTDGAWPTFSTLSQHVPPGTYLLSITVFGGDAECVDQEPGNIEVAPAAQWVKTQLAAGRWRPVVYTGAANARTMLAALANIGVKRDQIRLWTAHYVYQEHFCGPTTCNYTDDQADATQWTDHAHGRNLDQSTCLDTFLPTAARPPAGTPQWAELTEETVQLTLGDDGKAALPVPWNVSHLRLACSQGAHVNVQWPGSQTKTVTIDLTGQRRVDVALPADQTGQAIVYSGDAAGPIGVTWVQAH